MIRRTLRAIGRAPARILVSTLALALAVAAIGVFAIPTVAASSLRDAIERDGVANIILGTTDTGSVDVERLVESVGNVEEAEAQIIIDVPTVGDVPTAGDGTDSLTLVGADLGNQEVNIVRAETGRLPVADDEILAPDGALAIGQEVDVIGIDGVPRTLEVVGTGGTSFFEGDDVAFTTLDGAAAAGALEGVNRISVRAIATDDESLRATAEDIRLALADEGVTLQYLPITIEDGIHPVETEIEQISGLIGMLGIVAGIVGLVLLASTTNTLITERSREVAVMRALGAAPRSLRRRLRRLALGIALAAVVIGVPLGVVISNLIARMVLQEFVGLTPDVAVSVPVMIGSALFALIGARLVAARAAWRVTRRPLAEALRDRTGRPFGRKRSERVVASSRVGGLLGRSAVRNAAYQWPRSIAIASQIGAAVAALLIVASMATTINDFNDAEVEPWQWESMTYVMGPGLDIDASIVRADDRSEGAIEVEGDAIGWQVDVYGFEPGTVMIDRSVDEGRWFDAPGEAVVSHGFAAHNDIEVGDEVELLLASGPYDVEITGLHGNRGREFYLDRAELGTALGDPDGATRIFSLDSAPTYPLGGVVGQDRLDDLSDDDSGRTAVLLIFGAIGVVVVTVAGLAVASGIAVNIYERRHEIAAVQAIGGRRRHLMRLLTTELLWLGTAGLSLGIVGGYYGGRAIARSFETSNAVEIGFVFAQGALPVVIGVVLGGLVLLAAIMVRPATRRPIAETLRGAA